MASQYVERFKTARIRCNVRIPEEEFVAIALVGIRYFELVKHFEGKTFRDLFELANRISNFEKIQQPEVEIKDTRRKNLLYKELDHEVSLMKIKQEGLNRFSHRWPSAHSRLGDRERRPKTYDIKHRRSLRGGAFDKLMVRWQLGRAYDRFDGPGHVEYRRINVKRDCVLQNRGGMKKNICLDI
ncbi:hypothetical protein ACH5RR_032670 [Cinchona calisaya]|uniref:Uncharacterized protein n=1 Tax=Cinchona calisaya TaxID=153742 RepID=A0ABD2YP21_9GENT